MKKNKTLSTGLAILLIISLTGCGSRGGEKQNVENIESIESVENAAEEQDNNGELLTRLLINRGKMKRANSYIVEHRGQVYANDMVCLPQWNSIYDGSTLAVTDMAIVYTVPKGEFGIVSDLYRIDMKNNKKEMIAQDVNGNTIWIANEKVIYENVSMNLQNYELECSGVFWYDLNTGKTSTLLDSSGLLLSFDDDYVYFKASDGVVYLPWDGSYRHERSGVEFPDDLYLVEGDHYYCVTEDSFDMETTIRGYSIHDRALKNSHTLRVSNLITLQDGWAYYGDVTGIHKLEISSGKVIKLADFVPNMDEYGIGNVVGVILGDTLYFNANFGLDEGLYAAQLYKVPLNGGAMVDLERLWLLSC